MDAEKSAGRRGIVPAVPRAVLGPDVDQCEGNLLSCGGDWHGGSPNTRSARATPSSLDKGGVEYAGRLQGQSTNCSG